MSKNLVKERIRILFNEAKKQIKENKDLSYRYVYLIKKLSQRNQVRIPREIKRQICKCNTILIPGYTCTIKIKNNKKVVKCLVCGNVKRYKLKIK